MVETLVLLPPLTKLWCIQSLTRSLINVPWEKGDTKLYQDVMVQVLKLQLYDLNINGTFFRAIRATLSEQLLF